MAPVSLQDLPVEILTLCFENFQREDRLNDIKRLRLVSRHVNEASTPLLMNFVRVYLTSESLALLEDVSQHPIFGPSIRGVEVNCSIYSRGLAEDANKFATCHLGSLYNKLELREGFQGFDFGSPKPLTARERQEKIRYNERHRMSRLRQLVQRAYHEYQKRFQDQESVKQGNEHLERIGRALSRLPHISSITVRDQDYRPFAQSTADPFSDEALVEDCFTAMRWKGMHHPVIAYDPPVDTLAGLFRTLQKYRVFPTQFNLHVTPPRDLSVLAMEDYSSISNVLQQATDISINIEQWLRQSREYPVDNSRPHTEMCELGRLTSAFFDTQSIRHLDLNLGDYPIVDEVPQISLGELFPARAWPRLQSLSLRQVPFHLGELKTLVECQSDTITSLDMYVPYLLSGTWSDSLDVLRQLERLSRVRIRYPIGGEFGNGQMSYRSYPERAVQEYVLRGDLQNPLQDLTLRAL